MDFIRNIYCIGRNYLLHARELNNQVPKSPLIFSKPTHSLAEANGQQIFLPGKRGVIHFETELVVHIGRSYEKGLTADELIDKMAVGIDFTLRDVQTELKKQGYPWLLAKGFPNSAVLGRFIDFPGVENCRQNNFSLYKNEVKVQSGCIKDFIFDLQFLLDYIAANFGLAQGDIVFTGTPEGVGPVADGDQLSLFYADQHLGSCMVRMRNDV